MCIRDRAETPTDPLLAFEVGVSAWKAQACGDAVSYFYYFLGIADAQRHRKQIKEANGYIDKAETGTCQPLSRNDLDKRARDLYAQGQELELTLDYLGAAGKYERAYELLPENHSLAFRSAESYWAGRSCAEAEPHYRTFVAKADASKFADDVAKSQHILARIDAHGCPKALWETSVAGGGTAAANTSGATTDAAGSAETTTAESSDPPESGGDGGGSAHCSVDDDRRPAGAIGLALLALVGLVRRRRSPVA